MSAILANGLTKMKAMSLNSDLATQYILKHPNESPIDVSQKLKLSIDIVYKARSALLRQGKIPRQFNGSPVRKGAKESRNEVPLSTMILNVFRKTDSLSLEDICKVTRGNKKTVLREIKQLQGAGYNFTMTGEMVLFLNHIDTGKSTIAPWKWSNDWMRFGVCGDNHIGNKHFREDVLDKLYDTYQEEGIEYVFNTGNWIEGEANFNKLDLVQDAFGLDAQINLFLKKYPKRDGIKTLFIAGDDHEGWYSQKIRIEIGRHMELKAREAGRDDIIYLGYMEHDVIVKAPFGQTKIRTVHPGGGSAYATSYSVQKLVESYQGGEKPSILLVGHYHKAEYIPVRNVHVIQTATTCDQTRFMRKKKIAAHLGGWMAEFKTDERGAITRFRTEFMPFYDRGYYNWSFDI